MPFKDRVAGLMRHCGLTLAEAEAEAWKWERLQDQWAKQCLGTS
jgi:hypothetical protein